MEHFLKFLAVGGFGFVINTTVLILGVRSGLKPSLAGPLGAELAIISNFTLNNLWTFSDKAITSWTFLPEKFLQFSLLSFGSVIIQFLFLKIGERIFSIETFKQPLIKAIKLFDAFPLVEKIPFINKFSLYLIFYIAGVGVGLIWNFAVYTLIIWK